MDASNHARIQFHTASADDERSVLEAYLLDAVERLRDRDDCEHVIFIRAGHDPTVDGGLILLDIYGDHESIVAAESPRWDELVADELVTEWDRPEYEFIDNLVNHYGEDATRRHETLRAAATAMAPAMFDELDDQPPPVSSESDAPDHPIGWHRVLHILSNQWGYEIEAELDAHSEGVATTLEILEDTAGPAVAAEQARAQAERFEKLAASFEEMDAKTEGDDGVE